MTKECANDICLLVNDMNILQRDIEILNDALDSNRQLRALDIGGFYNVLLSRENISQLIKSKRKEIEDLETELNAL